MSIDSPPTLGGRNGGYTPFTAGKPEEVKVASDTPATPPTETVTGKTPAAPVAPVTQTIVDEPVVSLIAQGTPPMVTLSSVSSDPKLNPVMVM